MALVIGNSYQAITIASGQSLSAALGLGGARLAGIYMPAAWTAAAITFQASVDGTTFQDLYDGTGTEYSLTVAASRFVIVPLADFIGMTSIKVRSGTTGTPVAQGADRALTLVLANY